MNISNVVVRLLICLVAPIEGVVLVASGYWAMEASGWVAACRVLGIAGLCLAWVFIWGPYETAYGTRYRRCQRRGWWASPIIICFGLMGVNPWTMPVKMAMGVVIACILALLADDIEAEAEAENARRRKEDNAEWERKQAEWKRQEREEAREHKAWIKDEYERIMREERKEQEGKE